MPWNWNSPTGPWLFEPMQVIAGSDHKRTVHFEAPPSAHVSEKMNRFIEWFNATGPDERKALPALTRAALAHLYFECIRPFEDGNGRIGRALSEKALAQTLGRPSLSCSPTRSSASARRGAE